MDELTRKGITSIDKLQEFWDRIDALRAKIRAAMVCEDWPEVYKLKKQLWDLRDKGLPSEAESSDSSHPEEEEH